MRFTETTQKDVCECVAASTNHHDFKRMGDTGATDTPGLFQSSIDMASLVFARRRLFQHTLELIKNMAKYIPDNMDKDV
jgi:hypothetical protein